MRKLEHKRSTAIPFNSLTLTRPFDLLRGLYNPVVGEAPFFAEMTVSKARRDLSLDQMRDLVGAKIRREGLARSMRLKVALQIFFDRADIHCPDPDEVTHEAVYTVRSPRRAKKVDVSERVLIDFLRDCYYSPRPKDEPRYPDLRIQWEDLPWYRYLLGRRIRILAP